VAEPVPLLGAAAVALVIAIVLFVTGSWPFGLILLGVTALLLAAFIELIGRRPSPRLDRARTDARERATAALETWRVRAAATADARRIRTGLAQVDSARSTAFLRLGEAVHRGDEVAEAGAREQLLELDRRESELRAELDLRLEDAGERIRKAQLSVQETMMVAPPTPAQVPGPSPDPSE
jgi:hypothetical protein